MEQKQSLPELVSMQPASGVTIEEGTKILNTCLTLDNPPKQMLKELDQAFDAQPGLWMVVGNLAHKTRRNMIRQLFTPEAAGMAVTRAADELLRDLGYGPAGKLERLMIEQIALCWLDFHYTTQKSTSAIERGDAEISEYWDRRLSRSQGRYLKSIEGLARVRKLAGRNGPLQLNIGGQQVNVVAPERPE